MAGEDIVKEARNVLSNSSRVHALNDKDPHLDQDVSWLIEAMADEIERLREQWNTRFNTLCGLCGKRYLGPRDEHLHGYGACDIPKEH